MNANTPEKIYLQKNTTTDCYEEWRSEWFEARAKDTDIEYTRTDAFIEKALEYVEPIFTDYAGRCIGEKISQNFKNYMKGE